MRLTNFSDYAFRVLIFTAAHSERLVTIDELQEYYGISRGHLMKVITALSRAGLLESVRGRNGGLRLGKPPEEIKLDAIVRTTETDFQQVECMKPGGMCTIAGICYLPKPLHEAMAAYMGVLSNYTLADIMLDESKLKACVSEKPTFA